MDLILSLLILAFGAASYAVGLKQIIAGRYAPSVFSRSVWLLLAIISYGSVIASESTSASALLAGVFLLGNALMCVASFCKGTREVGKIEIICFIILLISGAVWVIFDTPLLTLTISLLAHFIGGVPTYKRVWEKPSNESIGFWSLFFIASALSVVASLGQPLVLIIFPIYFTLFDGSMTLLSMRKMVLSW